MMNKNKIQKFGILVVAGFFLVTHAFCQEIPKTMVKITTRVLEPVPEPGSFVSQPKTLWRAGIKYARIAEAPDTQHHIHGLMIVNEPNVWMINLFYKSGRHIVDSGPTFDVHLPIFQTPEEAKMKLGELEFGGELDFFTKNNAKPSAGEVINGKATDRYDVIVSGRKLVLWMDTKSKKPVRVSLERGMGTQTIEYLTYDDELPFDPSMFQPPDGIAIENAK